MAAKVVNRSFRLLSKFVASCQESAAKTATHHMRNTLVRRKKTMRYLPIIFILSIIFSCSEKGSEQSQAAEQVMSEPKPLEEAESKYSGRIKEDDPTAKFPEFAKSTIDALPDSIQIDVDHVIYGDFNADAKEDFSSKFTNLQNGKQGVIIIHNASNKADYFIFGGGQLVNGMDNLDWIDIFKPIPKGQTVAATLVDPETGDIIGEDEDNAVTLKGTGIYMHVDEAGGGGILYWDGRKYNWLHIE